METLPHDLAGHVLDGAPDAILICDPAGTVRYWNAAAERIFGFPATEAIGVSMNLIIPERLRARHWAAWQATMTTGITRYGGGQLLAVPALHKDGRQISIEFSIQLVKDTGDVIEWVVAVIRDMTERYRHEKALRDRFKILEAKMAPTPSARGTAEQTDGAIATIRILDNGKSIAAGAPTSCLRLVHARSDRPSRRTGHRVDVSTRPAGPSIVFPRS